MYNELLILDILIHTHFILTLLFGVVLSAVFVGMEQTKENYLKLGAFTLVLACVQVFCFRFAGEETALQLYPFLIHLPLLIFLCLAYKVSCYSAALAVSTAYLCCQITKWLGIAVVAFFPSQEVYYGVRILVTLPLLFFLVRYIAPSFVLLARLPFREVMTLGLMPFSYYIYDYLTTVYTKVLYSGSPLVVEFLGFFLSVIYMIFLFVFAREYIAKKELAVRNELIEMKIASTVHELAQTRYAQYQMSIMRHDMRHFISTTKSLILQGKYNEALAYLGDGQSDLEQIILQRFCTNEYINAIIAKYSDKCKLKKIDFQVEVDIAEIIPCPEVAFSTILDNALENAYKAASKTSSTKGQIVLLLKQNEDKLLLSVKNTYLNKPEFVDGLPVSAREGHGIGSRSIVYNCEKIGGQCQFLLDGSFFVLRVIV